VTGKVEKWKSGKVEKWNKSKYGSGKVGREVEIAGIEKLCSL
jgi:hypothetical protein